MRMSIGERVWYEQNHIAPSSAKRPTTRATKRSFDPAFMTNATTAPDAIAQRARHCLQDSPGCRVHGLQYRDALDAQAVAGREQREFALQQWRRTASQMLKEIRPRREIASGKGGARTPNPGIMRPFS